MTLLIIGGLLAIALLAILGAVFLGMSEQRAEKARSNGGTVSSSTGTRPVMEQQPAVRRAVEQSAPTRQNTSPLAERSLVSTEESQHPYALNGQFHELAVELQTLYQHARELERRLRTLAEVADRIEKTQSQVITEEEIHTQPSSDSTTFS
ncbi:MAG TPA: hypothetical protein VF844_02050 [Ktedonobacteraceae bacterium]